MAFEPTGSRVATYWVTMARRRQACDFARLLRAISLLRPALSFLSATLLLRLPRRPVPICVRSLRIHGPPASLRPESTNEVDEFSTHL